MNNIDAKRLIEGMYNQILHPQHGMMGQMAWDDPNLAMHFSIRISQQNYGYENDGNTHHEDWVRDFRRHVHFIVTARHRLYCAVTNEYDVLKVPASEFENLSNHDSEWRSGLDRIGAVITEAWNHCFAWMESPHRPKNYYYPQPFTVFGDGFACSRPLSFVRVKREPIEDREKSNRGYFDRITEVKRVKFTIQVEKE